jgi:hypothetical protein
MIPRLTGLSEGFTMPYTRRTPLPLREEQTAFEALLPTLLGDHAGAYVLFKDQAPVAFFASEEEALRTALARFGLGSDFLVAKVEKPDPQPISISWEAGVMFG